MLWSRSPGCFPGRFWRCRKKMNDRDKRNFRRDQRRRQHINRDISIVYPEKPELVCALCGEVIKETASSLALPETGEPAHFDCVMKKLEESETLEEGDTIAYLGGGNFGIIRKNSQNSAGFEIKKKIDFENKEKIGDWRKKLSYKL